jgi:hypothetical protein
MDLEPLSAHELLRMNKQPTRSVYANLHMAGKQEFSFVREEAGTGPSAIPHLGFHPRSRSMLMILPDLSIKIRYTPLCGP